MPGSWALNLAIWSAVIRRSWKGSIIVCLFVLSDISNCRKNSFCLLLIVIWSYLWALLPLYDAGKSLIRLHELPVSCFWFCQFLFDPLNVKTPIQFWSTRKQGPPGNEIERGGTWGEEEYLTISTPGIVWQEKGCPGEDLIRVHYGLRLTVPAGLLTLIRQKTASLFWDLPGFSRFDDSGTILELEMTANSTYCVAKLRVDHP